MSSRTMPIKGVEESEGLEGFEEGISKEDSVALQRYSTSLAIQRIFA